MHGLSTLLLCNPMSCVYEIRGEDKGISPQVNLTSVLTRPFIHQLSYNLTTVNVVLDKH